MATGKNGRSIRGRPPMPIEELLSERVLVCLTVTHKKRLHKYIKEFDGEFRPPPARVIRVALERYLEAEGY